jgi:hypothetical protein
MIKQKFCSIKWKDSPPKEKKGSTHLGLEISGYIMSGNFPHYTSDNAQVVQVLLICWSIFASNWNDFG